MSSNVITLTLLTSFLWCQRICPFINRYRRLNPWNLPPMESTIYCRRILRYLPFPLDALMLFHHWNRSAIVSWFAIACATKGNNTQGKGNQIGTYKSKKSAIVWFHRVLRNFTPIFTGADLVLIEKWYENFTSSPHPKQSFTVSMLCAARNFFPIDTLRGQIGYNCFVLSFFYLCRGGEM